MSKCENCYDTGIVEFTVANASYIGHENCQECCEHTEHDHGICLHCGKDNFEELAGLADDEREYYEKA